MTTDPLHLDEIQFSDAVDGHVPESVRTHLTDCASCRRRLAELTEVTRRVATMAPAPSPEAVDRDVARALAAAASPDQRNQHRRSPRLAAAAAIVLMVLGGAVVARIVDAPRTNHDTSASSDMSAQADADAEGQTAPDGAIDVGDVGPVGSATELIDRVAPSLLENASAPSASSSANAERGALDSELRCREATTVGEAATGTLRLVGTTSWQGQPAEVYVFVGDRDGLANTAVVVDSGECRLLTVASFDPDR